LVIDVCVVGDGFGHWRGYWCEGFGNRRGHVGVWGLCRKTIALSWRGSKTILRMGWRVLIDVVHWRSGTF